MLIIKGKTLSGKTVIFDSPVSFQYDADRYIPCDSFEFTAPIQFSNEEFYEITAQLNGKMIFEGIVDTQTTSSSNKGNIIKIDSRNKTALLLDNEVKPNIYFQLTSKQLFDEYASPFGVIGYEFPYEAKQNFIQVKKGSSYWKVINDYCLLVYKKPAYINHNNILTINPINNTTHTISNTLKNAIQYTNLNVSLNRHKLISKLYMKTSTETYGYYYGICIENKNAIDRKIKRERFYHPTSKVTANAKVETKRLVNQSNKDFAVIEVTIPALVNVSIGDNVKISDDVYSNNNLYISSVCHKADQNGIITKLKLLDKKFV